MSLTPEQKARLERMREIGRRGGYARAAKLRAAKAPPAPFAGDILQAMTAAGATGPTWEPWRTFWRAVYGLPLAESELTTFRECTGRDHPPMTPSREVWAIIGRRGGKTFNDALAATFTACRRDWRPVLGPGEWAVIPILAADRKQATQALSYVKGLAALPAFKPLVRRVLKESVEYRTGARVEVHTASYRLVRGYSSPLVVADELAFWTAETSANPDTETLRALRPSLSTLDGMLLGSSTPYAKRGELWNNFERYYGQDGDVLVWRAPSRTMNPGLAERVVVRAFEDDPEAASAEYGAEFRSDVSAFLDPDVVAAAIVPGRRELPPLVGVTYWGFVDVSGGSQDAFVTAVGHTETRATTTSGAGVVVVVDAIRERRPPFNADATVQEAAEFLKSYGVRDVEGDRYAGVWPRERFAVHGVQYTVSEKVKSDLYREMLPALTAGRVELLDVPRVRAQLVALERRVARSGKDSIDHPPGGKDDAANAVAGVIARALHRARDGGDVGATLGGLNRAFWQESPFGRPESAGYRPGE